MGCDFGKPRQCKNRQSARSERRADSPTSLGHILLQNLPNSIESFETSSPATHGRCTHRCPQKRHVPFLVAHPSFRPACVGNSIDPSGPQNGRSPASSSPQPNASKPSFVLGCSTSVFCIGLSRHFNMNPPKFQTGRHFDYGPTKSNSLQGRMAKQYLHQLADTARSLADALEDNDDLPQWVHYFIATANDRLIQAAGYMQYQIRRASAANKMGSNKIRSNKKPAR